MSKGTGKHIVGTILKVCLILVLVVVVGYGAWFGLSIKRASDLLVQVDGQYVTMQQSLEDQDFSAAIEDARNTAATTLALRDELGGLQWEIAGHLPVISEDVRVARSSADISNQFANEAVIPVLDAWEELSSSVVSENGLVDLGKLGSKASQLSELVHKMQDAMTVVDSCSEQLEALPTSHFDELNAYVDELRSSVSSTKALLGDFESLLTAYSNLESLTSGLFGSGDAGTAEAA